jgi:hypothetical protein
MRCPCVRHKSISEVKVQFYTFLILELDGGVVTTLRQLHPPRGGGGGGEKPVQKNRRLGGLQSRFACFGEGQYLLSTAGNRFTDENH